jgi:hypothetical protein
VSTRALLCAALIAAVTWSAPALAVDVYFNGHKVTGALQNQQFKDVALKFDAKGDVYIDAPGYKVEASATPSARPPVAAAPPLPAAPVVAQAAPTGPRYWLVLNAAQVGHYKVMVQANGRPVVDVPHTSPQYVSDVTDKLVQGANTLQVTFLPMPNAPNFAAPTEAVTVMVGHGVQAADGTLTIQRVLGTAKEKTGSRSATAQSVKFNLP